MDLQVYNFRQIVFVDGSSCNLLENTNSAQYYKISVIYWRN